MKIKLTDDAIIDSLVSNQRSAECNAAMDWIDVATAAKWGLSDTSVLVS